MKRRSWKFVKDEEGYVAVLALISMPFLMGLALLVMDVGRGNNLHTDVQQAVDAIALAGARELDGGPSSIDRAEAVMAGMLQNQTRFSSEGIVIMDGDRVEWQFLHSIPPHDDTPIDASYVTTDPLRAEYVQVRSLDQPMGSWFLRTVGLQEDVPFRAEAVAMYMAAACDITPLFMCNPFEADDLSFTEAFAAGLTYSREFRLLKSSGAPGAGNFGLLDTELHTRVAMGIGSAGACYDRRSVTTETGVNYGQVRQGLNTRFDMYPGMPQERNDIRYRPAVNVRKGDTTPGDQGNACNQYSAAQDVNVAYGFPQGTEGTLPNQLQRGITGNGWNRADYWDTNHPVVLNIPSSSHPSQDNLPPSRYDTYRFEIDNDLIGNAAPNGETGEPVCFGGDDDDVTDQPDRRVIFMAVVNCNAESGKISGKTALRPDAFASMFLVAPVQHESQGESPIRLEVIDVTGINGNGTLDTFMREEAVLVR